MAKIAIEKESLANNMERGSMSSEPCLGGIRRPVRLSVASPTSARCQAAGIGIRRAKPLTRSAPALGYVAVGGSLDRPYG